MKESRETNRLQNNSQLKYVWIAATKQAIEHSDMC